MPATQLTPEQIDDFVTLTLNKMHRHKWTDLSVGLTDYVYARLVTEKLVMEEGGPHIQFQIKTKNTGNARASGLYDKDNLQVEDVMSEAKVPWAKQTTGFIYDVDEPGFQSDRETIIKLLKVREHDAMTDLAELNEEHLWGAPTSSSDKIPMGIPFWLQKNASAVPEGGHTGGNPAGSRKVRPTSVRSPSPGGVTGRSATSGSTRTTWFARSSERCGSRTSRPRSRIPS